MLAAKRDGSQVALERLCAAYWYPVYGYIRSRGRDAEAAKDLTQEFFLRLLDKRYLDSIEGPRGRFRYFVQAAVKNFLANEYDRERALKRGGGAVTVSLEMDGAEERYRLEPPDERTPERIFDRRWGLEVLRRATERLAREQGGGSFEKMRPYLVGEEEGSYREVAAVLGVSEGTARVTMHRMRRRFAEVVRAEIGETVDGAAEVDEELRFLMGAVG